MRAGTRLALLLLLVAPAPAAAQGLLDQFSYEGLRLAGIGVDVGVAWSDRLERDISGALRVDAGFLAPRVRPLLSLSYLRAEYAADEIAELEARLRDVVSDPTNDFAIAVGPITLTTLTVDLDLQYLLATGPVVPYVGLGLGVHLRNADGAAITGTIVEDGLEAVVAALNGSAGFEVELAPAVRFTTEVRGILASGLRAVALRGGFMYRLPRRGTP